MVSFDKDFNIRFYWKDGSCSIQRGIILINQTTRAVFYTVWVAASVFVLFTIATFYTSAIIMVKFAVKQMSIYDSES